MTGHAFDCDPSARGSRIHGGGRTPRGRDLVEFKPDARELAAWTQRNVRARRAYASHMAVLEEKHACPDCGRFFTSPKGAYRHLHFGWCRG